MGITITGLIVLVLGLIVLGAGAVYNSVESEWVGGIVSVVGIVTGIAGAAAKKKL